MCLERENPRAAWVPSICQVLEFGSRAMVSRDDQMLGGNISHEADFDADTVLIGKCVGDDGRVVDAVLGVEIDPHTRLISDTRVVGKPDSLGESG